MAADAFDEGTTEMAKSAPIENVIFDMGQVLLRFDGMMFARVFTDSEEDAVLLDEALFSSPAWPLLDSGTISEETMEMVAGNRLPERLHANLREAMADWDLHQPAIPETNELASRMKDAGLGLYLLSNAGVRFRRARNRIPCYPLLDGCVVSAFERLMKPDPRIYRLVCDRFGLAAESCLFVDDNPDNVEGAGVAGMQGYVFDDAAGLERFMAERGMSLS